MHQFMRIAGALVVGVALSGCAAEIRNHGYIPAQDELAQLQVGVDTQADVASAVGRPTSTGVLGAESWYYVQSRFRHYGYREPVEVDREVVAISYDGNGRLANIERFGLQEGRVVPISRRVTERNVQGVGFLRQLFGNIGQFNPADFLGG